jgi:cytochrome c553
MRLILMMSFVATCAVGCQATSPIHSARADDNAPAPVKSAAALSVAGDAARGKSRSAELYCDACHGNNGNSDTAEWPSLAGQNALYLAKQLELLRSGKRASPEMQPMAAPLSDSDIADLAVHYAAQPVVASAATGSDEFKLGESLYRDGDPARAIPACSSCHGPAGEGNPTTGDPAVRSQQPGYSSRQLEAYARHTRYSGESQLEQSNVNLKIMREIAEKLTTEEIRSLAAYLRAMP